MQYDPHNSYEYNGNLFTKYFLVELYVLDHLGRPYNPCGSEYSILYSDLKTLTGVLNRLKKHIPFDKMAMEVVGFKIYSYTDIYNRDDFVKYVDTIDKFNKYDNIFGSILEAQRKHYRDHQWTIPEEDLSYKKK